MRLSTLSLAAILVFTSATFAQHSSGSGSSSGSSSSGGGSHSSSAGSSGGSSYSGGSSHASASGGHNPGSTAHSTSSHGSNSSASAHTSGEKSKWNPAHTNDLRWAREPNLRTPTRMATPEKRTFFSRLRHVFRHPRPELRRPVCFRGPCLACPIRQGTHGGGCAAPAFQFERNPCPVRELWSGGACLLQVHFLDDCSALLMALRQEEMRMRAADSAQQSACGAGPTQECSGTTSTFHSEQGLYRSLQARYEQCRQRSLSGYLAPAGTSSGLGLMP